MFPGAQSEQCGWGRGGGSHCCPFTEIEMNEKEYLSVCPAKLVVTAVNKKFSCCGIYLWPFFYESFSLFQCSVVVCFFHLLGCCFYIYFTLLV